VDRNAFRRRQRIAQFKQRDVGILGDEFLGKGLVRRELATAFGATLRRGGRMTPRSDRPRPPRLSPARASGAARPPARSNLLRYIAETAQEAPSAKVLT